MSSEAAAARAAARALGALRRRQDHAGAPLRGPPPRRAPSRSRPPPGRRAAPSGTASTTTSSPRSASPRWWRRGASPSGPRSTAGATAPCAPPSRGPWRPAGSRSSTSTCRAGRSSRRPTRRRPSPCFILPPDAAELARRLRGRSTDGEEVIRARLAAARAEVARAAARYQYVVVNDELEEARRARLERSPGRRGRAGRLTGPDHGCDRARLAHGKGARPAWRADHRSSPLERRRRRREGARKCAPTDGTNAREGA